MGGVGGAQIDLKHLSVALPALRPTTFSYKPRVGGCDRKKALHLCHFVTGFLAHQR